jgi:hypothetical protein
MSLPLLRRVAAVFPRGLDSLPRTHRLVLDGLLGLGLSRAALEDVEFVELPFAVVALLGGAEEVTLLSVG